MSDQDIFTGNVEELRKIIKENPWLGLGNQDMAIEFLEAIEKNHTDQVDKLKVQIEERDDEISDLQNTTPNFDGDDHFVEADIGVGSFTYMTWNINFDFLAKLEQFIEDFKNGKA